MRFPSRNKHRAHCTFRVSATVLVIAVLPFLLHASAPSWWTQRGVLVENKAADDYAEANQGQLKNIARAAAVEMDARLTGGAGDNIHRLIASWSVVDTRTNDFAPINLGQLKNIAKPFYDRLISVGLPEVYPWLRSQSLADDFAVANIGQVKNLFSFGIPAANVLDDARGDRLAANDASANLAVESHSVWIWGDHLISGTDFERNFPRRITELSAVKAVTAGEHHLATLHVDGSVSVWGDNDAGQLGDGTNVSRPAPALLSNLSNITSIKAGGWHTLALQQDGTILAWGDNAYGQLGTGDTNGSLVPTPVIGLDNIIKISASAFRSVALKIDGTVWSWGYERYNGVDVYDPTPLLAPSLADVLEIAAGYEHTVAVKSDGTVWVWGSNYSNQLGNGSSRSIYQAVPLQVPGLSNITKVASSYDHTLAIANDGTVWAWGYNAFGQLGDGTSDQKPTPVRVAGLTDIIAIATTYSSSFAMKTDGTVWAWGDFAPGVLPGTNPRVPQQVGLGLFDSNHNGMDDRWEIHFFGNLDQAGDADFDGDGISNQAEYLRGTDPTDYYNGATPVIEIAGGNNQLGAPGTFLTKPFKVRVRNAAGQILVNAPIKFAIANRLGGLATIGGGAQQQAIRARTDGNGEAFVYHALPNIAGTSTRTTVAAGDTIILAAVTFRAITPFSPPPQSTPPPDPNASPTPTPDPSATPIAPYRHAIIDLGKDVHPLRINNKGWILAQGYDSNGNWGNFRWKGGVLEQLNYSGPNTIVQPQDMNDAGAVVGLFSSNGSWLSNKENELFAGLLWPADNANAVKISSPSAPRTFEPQIPGTFRKAELSAVNNRGDVYGEACTGTVRGFANHTIMVMNALIWPGGVAPPEQLSFATATNNPPDSHLSSWQGTSDRISRANGARHYIGRKTTSYTADGVLQETSTGMIDGQAADFEPIDLNETGIVVGNKPSNGPMVIRTLGSPTPADVQVPNTFPIAINDHSRPSTATGDQVSPTATPQPTPIPAPQVLAWTGNALALWELQSDGQTWHPFGLEEMIPSMDGWDNLAPSDMNDTGLIVGTGYYTDPSKPGSSSELHGFLLVPVELMVDGNRDGKMSFDDPVTHANDQTTEERPYRFWVNDDQDAVSGTTRSEEITPPQLRDNQDEKIQSPRDCEDLARLRLNIRGLTERFKTGETKLVLRFRNLTSGSPAIRVFRAVENGGRGYVSNEAWGALQVTAPYDQALPGTNGPGIASSNTGIYIDRRFWDGIDESDPTINLLFEAVDEGVGELYLDIIKDGQRIGVSPGIWLEITNVQKMYDRAKAQPENIVGPYTVFQPFVGPVNYVADPNGNPFSKAWDETDQCVVFVHGWNVSYDEYLGVAQTMFKRLWHQGFKGHFASFRWDTRKSDGMFDTGEFNRSENRAYVYAAALKQWAADLSKTYTVNAIAHSMGNVVCGEALQEGMRVRNYLLMEAAIPMSCYVSDAVRLPRFEDKDRDYPTPDYHRNPTTNELTLGYRGYVSSVVANMVNFYNEDDWALVTGTTEIVPGLPHIETNWEKNQIDYKPDGAVLGAIHSGSWSYSYDRAVPPTLPLQQRASVISAASRNVTDSWEMKAFVSRSRTKAVGAFPNGDSIFSQNVNLATAPYNFGRERSDHSGQFTRDIQKVDALYHTIRQAVEQ